MGFSRQKYWSGLPFPSPGDMENPGYPWVSFPTLGSNPDLLHCRQILYQLGNKGKLLSQPKPRIKRLGLNGGTRLGTQIWAWQPNRPEFIDCNSLQKTTKHWLCTRYDVGRAASPMRPARPDHTQDSVLEPHYSVWIQEKPDLIVSWNRFMCPACQSAKSHKLWIESIKEILGSNVMQLLKVAILILCFLSEKPEYRV